jgi:hypothetical protein
MTTDQPSRREASEPAARTGSRWPQFVAAAAVATAVASVVLLAIDRASAPPEPAALDAAPTAAAPLASGTQAVAERMAAAVFDDALVPATPVPDDPPTLPSGPEPTGVLIVSLIDAAGSPAPGRLVDFVRKASGARQALSRKAITQAHGDCVIEAMPVGRWEMRYIGAAREHGLLGTGVVLGEFEVAEGLQTVFRGALASRCVLSGTVLMRGYPDAMIQVEVFALLAPDRPVAAGGSYTPSNAKPTRREQLPPDKQRRVPADGSFRFEGLAPGRYTLRFWCGTTKDGVGLFVDHAVELGGEDLALPPVELTIEQLLASRR